jgi:hypothetical protein
MINDELKTGYILIRTTIRRNLKDRDYVITEEENNILEYDEPVGMHWTKGGIILPFNYSDNHHSKGLGVSLIYRPFISDVNHSYGISLVDFINEGYVFFVQLKHARKMMKKLQHRYKPNQDIVYDHIRIHPVYYSEEDLDNFGIYNPDDTLLTE